MGNIETIKLAWKVARRLYNHFGDRNSTKLMAREFVDVIRVIQEDYNIVPKER